MGACYGTTLYNHGQQPIFQLLLTSTDYAKQVFNSKPDLMSMSIQSTGIFC